MILTDRKQAFSLESSQFHNEIGVILSLWSGLNFAAHHVRICEDRARASINGSNLASFAADMESEYNLPPGANSLLPCFHHWFGTSSINMVRMIGYLKGLRKGAFARPPFTDQESRMRVKAYCNTYVSEVVELQPVHIWRNKVFAHFAMTDPFANDTIEILQQISFYPISYGAGNIKVGAWQVATFSPEGQPLPQGPALPSWILTDVMTALGERYQFMDDPVP